MWSIYLTLKGNEIVNFLITIVNLWMSWSIKGQENLYHFYYVISKLKQWRLTANMNALLLWEKQHFATFVKQRSSVITKSWEGLKKGGGFGARDISHKENTVCAQDIGAGIQDNCEMLPVPPFCFLEDLNKQPQKCAPDPIALQSFFYTLPKSI